MQVFSDMLIPLSHSDICVSVFDKINLSLFSNEYHSPKDKAHIRMKGWEDVEVLNVALKEEDFW